jgi:tetratricopeptide (TPR) repeat protein
VLGRFDEAEEAAERARSLEEELGTPDYSWRQVLARVKAHRGDRAEAERLTREAVAATEEGDLLNEQCLAHWDLGEVLAAAGRPDEAAASLEQALDRCRRKKNLALARQARERLAELRPETQPAP